MPPPLDARAPRRASRLGVHRRPFRAATVLPRSRRTSASPSSGEEHAHQPQLRSERRAMERDPGPVTLSRYAWEPSYSGIQTFMKLPLCLSPQDLEAGGIDVAIGGVPWDGTNTARAGTHLGPQAVRRCDNLWAPPYGRPHLHTRIDPFQHLKLADYGDSEVIVG